MKLDKQTLLRYATKLLEFFKKYATFIFVLIILMLFGFLIYQIRTVVTKEPSEDMVTEKIGQQKPITIDKSAVEKIQQLQSTNVEVKALFNQKRDNPFKE